ncbi:hypothetical protein GYMLUDRAFT_87171 [Collybiopsis luxurians FD-317 M1]|uniref:DUF6570 domain-containing protein n=1 Tax=Collybiopsis luxurians FD-317 M1 TaxID=944289 RepID=A0A0D0BPF6_9AGAR|nr:hypothetical protein GYMLUDRAFT_87171 [Collybiopsis luxurians FD-317 M1]
MLSSWSSLHSSMPSYSWNVLPASTSSSHSCLTPTDKTVPNCNDTVIAQSSNPNTLPSSPKSLLPLLSHSDFVCVSIDNKHYIFNSLKPLFSMLRADNLHNLISFHVNISVWTDEGCQKSVAVLCSDLMNHQCEQLCLIKMTHANGAGFFHTTPLSESDFALSAKALRHKGTNVSRSHKCKADNDALSLAANKKFKADKPPLISLSKHSELISDADDWLEILSCDEKQQILQEEFDANSNNTIHCFECSVCGTLSPAGESTLIPCSKLDISLLNAAVQELQEKSFQPEIQSFNTDSIENGCFHLCSLCKHDVHYDNPHSRGPRHFIAIPVRSYANGLWTGTVPEALQGLTFLEEPCIAQASATRCMFKLELGPTGQYASRGNVCVLPQDPGPLLS